MPLPKALGRFNRLVTNPAIRGVAQWVPPLGVVGHVGRTSKREYGTPVLAFPTENGFVIALTYGPDVDWVKNVLAAKRGTLTRTGRTTAVREPRIVRLPRGPDAVPAPIRAALRTLRAARVIALGRDGAVVCDLRAVDPSDDERLVRALRTLT